MKNVGNIKRYFHTFSFQDCFVFHLITLVLEGFLMLSDLLKPALEKVAKNVLNKSRKIIKQSVNTALGFLHKKRQ